MNKLLIGALATFTAGGAGVGVIAARHEPMVRANVYVGPVAVGGLAPVEAGRRLRIWWEGERTKKLKVVCSSTKVVLPDMTPGALGVGLDDQGLVAKLPLSGFGEGLAGEPDRIDIPLEYKGNGANLVPLATLIKEKIGKPHPAQVRWVAGSIETTPESTIMKLDAPKVKDAVIEALEGDRTVDLPLQEAPKHISDEALAQVTDLVSEYTTHFPASNRPRCANIKLASSKLNGVILMPGERLSFNGTVGRRTLRAGFKLAGVYKQGKHDVGVGGGICQVSTTLYNAALFANLKVVQRSNHSLPVAYVPLGRDATVDYGSLDLVLENNMAQPLGVVCTYSPGSLTFRLLGKKDPTLSVKVVQEGQSSWDRGVKTVVDRTLRPGTRRVIEKGSAGHAVRTYRMVYRNGVLEKKESLGRSYYGGGPRIVAVGPAAAVKPRTMPTPMAGGDAVVSPPPVEVPPATGDGL